MLQIKNISKIYHLDSYEQKALDDVSVNFRDNEFVAILGPSGSGKTTLLNIIGGLDHYDEGDLIINHVSTKDYKDKDWDAYRNSSIGFIFQAYNLIAHQSVLANVEMAMTLTGVSRKERRERALEALEKVGLSEHVHKKPNQLSGGQMQRVAIARALVNNPPIILADEPTGALDSATSVQVMDLLKEVAQDRLVIMVTHNPELAEEYATRIVNLSDGKITDDSHPFLDTQDESNTTRFKHTKLSFLSALSLSLANLLTKKGRTALTSFAGSIGIIGIALILALSHGVNQYIADQENDMLGSYPIELEKQAIDLSTMVNHTQKEKSAHDQAKIYSRNLVADTVETSQNMIKQNDLAKFKSYLEKNKNNLQSSVSAIEYSYNMNPQVYRLDKDKVVKVSPATLISSGSSDSSGMQLSLGSNMSMGGLSSTWTQMVSDKKLRNDQYELIKGKWPSSYNEVALIMSENNEISDYSLYTLGLMDYDHMQKLIKQVEDGKEVNDEQKSFTYDSVLGKEYKVFAPSQMYEKTDKAYVDKSSDNDYVKKNLSKGLNVKIVAVLRSNDKSSIKSGIGYDASLSNYLLKLTADSGVVKQQLNNPKINVLTGKKFGEKSSTNKNPFYQINPTGSNVSRMLRFPILKETEMPKNYTVTFKNYNGDVIHSEQINEGETLNALSFETPKRESTKEKDYVFVGWMGPNGFLTSRQITNVQVTNDVTYTATFVEYTKDAKIEDYLPEGMTQSQLNNAIEDYIKKQATVNPQANVNEKELQKYISSYLKTDVGQKMVRDYMKKYAQSYMKTYQKQMASKMKSQMSSYMKKYMQNYMKKYMSKLKGSMNMNLSKDQLQVLLAQMSDTTPTSYDEMLSKLSYYTEGQPSKISIYPNSFDGKEKVDKFINSYNKQVSDDKEKVTYTDLIGVVTKNITSIVDTISYVLIAFVAISLVVSSIMIAIITYISVLERTKEIGILRALGASKNGISKIFNAETFIEGLLSGVFGIIVTLLLCIPINAIVKSLVDVDQVARLPLEYGVILILISVFLTLVAGFFPSRIAAKKDPVTSLRSE